MKNVLLFIILISLSAACSSKNEGETSNTITFQSQSEALKALHKISVECGEPLMDCPSSVGGLGFVVKNNSENNDWATAVCSMTLIESNKVLTNHHCLPQVIASSGSICENKIRFFFPKTKDYPKEEAGCLKVITTGPSYNANQPQRPDWAILELDKEIKRPFALTDNQALPTKMALTSYPVYYTKNGSSFTGKILKNICTTGRAHYTSHFYFHESASVTNVESCTRKIIRGNSGSGFFNSDNQVVMLGSYTVITDSSNLFNLNHYGNKYIVNNKFMGGTRIGCMDYFKTKMSPFCYHSDSINFYQLLYSNNFGYDLSFVKKELIDQSQAVTTENPAVQWESPQKNGLWHKAIVAINQEKFNTEIESKYFQTDKIPSEIIDYVSLNITQTSIPYVPACIKQTAPKKFELEIPFLDKREFDSTLNKDGLLNQSFKYEPMRIQLSKKGKDQYNASLILMNSDQKIEFLDLFNQMILFQSQCHKYNPEEPLSKVSKSPCQTRAEIENQINKWFVANNLPEYLKRNELISLVTKGSLDEFLIPVCP